MNDRNCLECNESLKGRADQKFCDDHCRSTYNNRRSVESNNVIRAINRILKKNYFILSSLNPGIKTTANKSDLLKKGYRFDYYTGTHVNPRNMLFYFCYDQGYSELENNKVMLIRSDPNGDLLNTGHRYGRGKTEKPKKAKVT